MCFTTSSEKARQKMNVPTMKQRYSDLTDRFILKEYENDLMAWFQDRPNAYLSKLRNPRVVLEAQCRTAKVFKGPINYYKRRVNELLDLQNNPGSPN